MNEGELREGRVKYLVIAYLTAFIGGFCVMVVELIAGRLIARYLGMSLYTWTSVIGVVLAGITLGNYIGGRMADRYHPQKALSGLFILASASCVLVPVLNQMMGNLPLLFHLPWPVRITMHVAIIFFLPSCILGMISPVVAKFALDQGFKTGRTIGNVYAWGAGGSILGTFITGFFLIAHMGTVAVIWAIAGMLGIIGLLYGVKRLFSYVWLVIFVFLFFVSLSQISWAKTVATHLLLKEPDNEKVVYEKDSQYSHIKIVKKSQPGVYDFMLDGLTHSKMNIDEPTNPEYTYGYCQTYADIAENFAPGKKRLSVLILGGGGYVFPRYIENLFPESYIEVVEIDPEVTKAAIEAFGLSPKTDIKIHHLDARNYIDEMVRRKLAGEEIVAFDFIYGDVIFGLAVPYHLTTYEYNQKIGQLLAADGLYIVTLVDSIKLKQFLSAIINTLKETFACVYVVVPPRRMSESGRFGTFVIVASLKEIDKEKFASRGFRGRLLNEDELKTLRSGSKNIVLTDDFAPVDNLLKEAFRMQGERIVCTRIMEKGERFIEERRLQQAIDEFKKTLRINPDFVEAYNNIGTLKAWQGRYDEAIGYYYRALSIKTDFSPAVVGLASVLERKGRYDEAIDNYYRALELNPDVASIYVSLANALNKKGRIDEAIENYRKALAIDPELEVAKRNLAITIREKQRREENE